MNRPEITQKVIDVIAEVADSQDAKGLEKYGVTIDDAAGYNWDRMAVEELVDGMKYMVKRNRELEAEVEDWTDKAIMWSKVADGFSVKLNQAVEALEKARKHIATVTTAHEISESLNHDAIIREGNRIFTIVNSAIERIKGEQP